MRYQTPIAKKGNQAMAIRKHLLGGAVAVGAIISAVTTAIPTFAATTSTPSSSAVTTATIVIPSQYTRQTLNLSGTWELTSLFTMMKGVPVRATTEPGNDVYVNLKLLGSTVSPPGNEPVYEGNVYDRQGNPHSELFVSPFVSPRGIMLTMWQPGNPEGFTDAYECVYGVQATNTTRAPLSFAETWTDQDRNEGTSIMKPAPGIRLPS